MTKEHKGLLSDILDDYDRRINVLDCEINRLKNPMRQVIEKNKAREMRKRLRDFINDVPEWLRQAILDKQQLQRKGKAKSYIITEAAEMLADAVDLKS